MVSEPHKLLLQLFEGSVRSLLKDRISVSIKYYNFPVAVSNPPTFIPDGIYCSTYLFIVGRPFGCAGCTSTQLRHESEDVENSCKETATLFAC